MDLDFLQWEKSDISARVYNNKKEEVLSVVVGKVAGNRKIVIHFSGDTHYFTEFADANSLITHIVKNLVLTGCSVVIDF